MSSTRFYFKKARESKGLTQKKVSELSNVTETTIRNIENKRSNPSFQLSIKLSKILEQPFEDLWKEDFQ